MRIAVAVPLLLLLPSTALAEDAFDAALARGRGGPSCGWLREALLLRPDRADVREELAACEEAQGSKPIAAAHWASLAHEARLRVFSFDHEGARLVVRAPSPTLVPGLQVTVAGAEIPASLWGGAPVAVGTLPFRVTVPGKTLLEGTLRVGPEGAVLDVPQGPEGQAVITPREPLTRPRSASAVAGGAVAITLGGLGLVGGITMLMIQTSSAADEDGIHTGGAITLLASGGLLGAGIPLVAWGGRRVPVTGEVASVAPLVTPLFRPAGSGESLPMGAVLSVAGVLR